MFGGLRLSLHYAVGITWQWEYSCGVILLSSNSVKRKPKPVSSHCAQRWWKWGFDCHRFLAQVFFLHRIPHVCVVPPTRIPMKGKSLGHLVLWDVFGHQDVPFAMYLLNKHILKWKFPATWEINWKVTVEELIMKPKWSSDFLDQCIASGRNTGCFWWDKQCWKWILSMCLILLGSVIIKGAAWFSELGLRSEFAQLSCWLCFVSSSLFLPFYLSHLAGAWSC